MIYQKYSLKTLETATPQEIIDQICEHLLTQNQKAVSYIGFCKYRTVNEEVELKCAAGCLISDDEYTKSMESTSFLELTNTELNIEFNKLQSFHILLDIVIKLQRIHDNYPRKVSFDDITKDNYNFYNYLLEKEDNSSWYEALKEFVLSEGYEWKFS